jgi:hypothetical protein
VSDLKTPTVPISRIDVDPGSNVRTHIDEKKLKGLILTVEAIGIRQPIEVRPKENGRFELIADERRYLAAERAGLKEVPVTIGEGNAHLSKVIENLQREDLGPIGFAMNRQYLFIPYFSQTLPKLLSSLRVEWRSVPNENRRLIAIHLFVAERGHGLCQEPLNHCGGGIVALAFRHRFVHCVSDFRQDDSAVDRSRPGADPPEFHKLDAASVIEDADVLRHVAYVLAHYVGDFFRAELALVEDRDHFESGPVVKSVGHRFGWRLRSLV